MEEEAYKRWKGKYAWLTLETVDGEHFLGCSECKNKPGKKERGFASGKCHVGTYFYERTLKQHVASTIHKGQGGASASVEQLQDESPLERTPPRLG